MAYVDMIQRGGLGQIMAPDVAPPNGGICDPSSGNYNPVACIPSDASGYPPMATPPIASDQSDTYTLPVEVFTQTIPVPVSRPEPTMAPIPTELPPTTTGPLFQSSLSIGLILAMMAGLFLTLPGKRKR